MKVFKSVAIVSAMFASAAQAHIGDIELSIQDAKQAAVIVAQPVRVSERLHDGDHSCILPLSLTHLVAIPDGFATDDNVVMACAVE